MSAGGSSANKEWQPSQITEVETDRLIVSALPSSTNEIIKARMFPGAHMDIRQASSHVSYEFLLPIQKSAFGSNIYFNEFDQLLEEGRGVIYVAKDKKGSKEVIGYAVLQTENLNENAIQKQIKLKKSDLRGHSSTAKFHDHLDYPLPPDTVLVAELGIRKEYQKKGYGLELLKAVMEAYQTEHGGKYWTSFVRINNIGSLKIITGLNFGIKNNLLLGSRSMIGMQGPTLDPFGSKETNFRTDSIIPAIDALPPDSSSSPIWKEGNPKPSGKHFFLPMPPGEQKDLQNSKTTIDMLKMVMAYGRIPVEGEDFVMRRVCSDEELRKLGVADVKSEIPYLFFTKDWNYGTE